MRTSLRYSKELIFSLSQVSRSSTSRDYPVEFVCAIRDKNTLKAFENFLRVHGVFCFRKIVDGVGIITITEHGPDDTAVGFTKTFFDNRHCGGISQNQTTLQEEHLHSFDDGFQKVCRSFEPAAHVGTVNGQAGGLEDLFLAVERQVKEALVGRNFSEQTLRCFAFINRLKWLFSSEDMLAAFFAAVLVDDMFNFFKDGFYKVDLRGYVKTKDSSFVAAVRTSKRHRIRDSMLLFAVFHRICGRSRAPAAFVFVFDDVEISFFVFKFFFCLRIDGFASASEKSRIDLGGLFAEGCTVAAAELFFQCGDASEEITNEVLAVGEIVRQFIGGRSLFSHFLLYFCSLYLTVCTNSGLTKDGETSVIEE